MDNHPNMWNKNIEIFILQQVYLQTHEFRYLLESKGPHIAAGTEVGVSTVT